MTSASCPTTLTTCRPCWINYEHMHKESLSLSIHKSLRWCASTLTPAICPLSNMMGRSSPTQTPSNIWAWFVTDISTWILQLMQRYVHSHLVLSASDSSFGNMTLQTGYTFACGSLKRTQSLLVCMQAKFGPPHSYDRAKKWTILCKNGWWQCSRGFWWSRTQLLLGVSCANVV